MGTFYSPPPVFTGGAQPYDQRQLPPSVIAVPVSNPAFTNGGRTSQYQAIIRAWDPPPPGPFEGDLQSYGPRQLPPSLEAVPVNDPPFSQEQRQEGLYKSIVTAWEPGPIAQVRLPKLTASGAAVAATPTFGLDWLPGVLNAWQPVAPMPSRALLPPSIIAVQVDNPTFREIDLIGPIISAWAAIPTLPQQVRYLVQPAGAVSADNPPFREFDPVTMYKTAWEPRQPSVYSGLMIVQDGTFVPSSPTFSLDWLPGVLTSWEAKTLAPQPLRVLPQPSITLSAPPTFGLDWLPGVLSAWQPLWASDYSRRLLNGVALDVPVNNPPFGVPSPVPSILKAWEPGPPLPTLTVDTAAIVSPPVVNDPPFTGADSSPVILASWEVRAPILQKQQFSPQLATALSAPPTFGLDWLPGVLSAWQPAPALLPLRALLPPSITAVPVNDPPFSSRDVDTTILRSWEPLPPRPQAALGFVAANIVPLFIVGNTHVFKIDARGRVWKIDQRPRVWKSDPRGRVFKLPPR